MSDVVLRPQWQVLAERYVACLLGDPATLLLLLVQAPLIGWLCTVAWAGVESDTPSLHFVLCLSAVWFGCIGACREIVKERAILERERLFGLRVASYVRSKATVLVGLGLVQVLLLQIAVEWQIGVRGPFLVQTAALWGASAAGTGLGLVVSALSRAQERAVGAVPLLLLPQILFSKFVLPERFFTSTVQVVEKAMPVRWAFRVFEEAAATEPSWLQAAAALGAVWAMALGLFALSTLCLIPRQEA